MENKYQEIEAKISAEIEKEFLELDLPDHMLKGVQRYLIHGIPPGGFLTAIFENKFVDAFGRADLRNLRKMREWACFLYNYVAMDARGEENFIQWCRMGGFIGIEKKHDDENEGGDL